MNKLLQINTTLNTGSTGRIAEDIGKMVMSKGWDSYIAYGRNRNESQSKELKVGNKLDNIIHGVSTRVFDNHGLMSHRSTKEFIQRVENIQPTIIHLHNIHGYYLNYKLLFEYLGSKRFPIVWTLHDCWPLTGHCAFFDFLGCNKWQSICHDCPGKSQYPSSLIVDNSRNNFLLKKELINSARNLHFVPVSNWLSNILHQSFVQKKPKTVINNGIDLEIFTAKDLVSIEVLKNYKIDNCFVVLGVANQWAERKGLNDFIRLSSLVEDDVIIILIGVNKNELRQLPSNVIGVYRTNDQNELADYYNLADVFVNPTYEDNLPTTNLEALGCGTPVITYNTGGCNESVCKDTGVIVEKGDVLGISQAIKHIKRIGTFYYRQKCVEKAQNKFNKNIKYEEYYSLYSSLL